MTTNPQEGRTNTYLNDPESGAEMARLLNQDHMLNEAMGGLLPELGNLDGIHDVLDIACGPGGWVQELAFARPDIEVTGFDISQAMISFACQQAQVQRLENAHFLVMDATQPLQFADNSFDLVNARTIAGFMRTSLWPKLVKECVRILRPGGILRLTETDTWGVSNKEAFQRLMNLSYRAAHLTDHCFDPIGQTFGITALLERFLAQAGCQDIRSRATAINFSAGAKMHQAMLENVRVFFKLIQPLQLRLRSQFPDAGMPNQEELDYLYNLMLAEMLDEEFAAIFYLLTVWGQKPS
jgi:ubiquinone/menaquinone biosynthesis C-methylase UbiE